MGIFSVLPGLSFLFGREEQTTVASIQNTDRLFFSLIKTPGIFCLLEEPRSINICQGHSINIKCFQNIFHFILYYVVIGNIFQKSHLSPSLKEFE